MSGKNFTESEDQFIRENYMDMTDKEIAAELGRPVGGVTNRRINTLGLTKYSRQTWTPEEEQILIELYPDTENEEILKQLPRWDSVQALYHKAYKLGLNKSDEFMQRKRTELGRALAESDAAKANRFDKGHEPVNEGLKQEEFMSEEAIEATKATRFKEGHKPHSTKWDGAITIRYDHKNRGGARYMWIRISENNWKQYQHYLWEKVNGPIPDDKILACKDGNTLDCSPDNWELITRAENARRNQNLEKAIAGFEKYREEHGGSPSEILSDGYVAALLAGGDQDMKGYIIENEPQMIKTARAYYLARREVMEVENG